MAKERPEYEVNDEFNQMAVQIVEKYPDHFYGIKVDRVCCVNIINKERPEAKKKLWQLDAVKMPMALHCPYSFYVILYSGDWEAFSNTQKLLLVAEVLHGIPSMENQENEGKTVPMDTRGYASMFRTFGGIDFLDDPNSPNILDTEIKWRN